ncbi:helix-turn-helix domain-containing protein [Thalassotalea crassostreae]|uniref:helix-turn-helix domain-containing protein n=1 Tax=Thalassotalea crassostreae TaxID=1763536 RepID=UPI0008388DA6|nr:helix-turn-helix transcriptional regulator [Thalassotalea crassostreae]
MILAEKIVKLRKQLGWSQEELAEKLNVSRQSVSKWESTNSIPDLNRIIMLAELFDVSTDFLLKDENEVFESSQGSKSSDTIQVSLEQATKYIDSTMEATALNVKGVLLCVCSVIPLLFLLAMADSNKLNLTSDIAAPIGVVFILIMVSIAVSFFLKTNQYDDDTTVIDDERFELAYGVHGVFSEKMKKFRPTYNRRLSIGIFLFIVSFVPLMFAAMSAAGTDLILMMLIVLLLIISAGLYLVIPVSTKYDALNNVLRDSDFNSVKSKRAKRAEKLAAFYWPLLIAIFLGWSLWTMAWGITWIIWPVGAVLFAALIGLMELFAKDEEE